MNQESPMSVIDDAMFIDTECEGKRLFLMMACMMGSKNPANHGREDPDSRGNNSEANN